VCAMAITRSSGKAIRLGCDVREACEGQTAAVDHSQLNKEDVGD
jgi:hypothetical protein